MEKCRKTFQHETKNSGRIATDLSFVDSDDSSDSKKHMDFLSGNDTRREHSDEDDHAELRAAIEEIDIDNFEGLYEDFYEDTVTNVQQILQAVNTFQLVLWLCPFISFWQYTFSITDNAVLFSLKSLQVLLEMLVNIWSFLL